MAEKHGNAKKGKKHLHKIITTRAQDGSFGHEHVYKDDPHAEASHQPVFAGTSQSMDDLHQHMDDHFGGSPSGEGAEPEASPAAEAPGEAPE